MDASTARYVPRRGDRPCVNCAQPVHPGDAAQTRLRHGTQAVLCLTCLRALEQQYRERRRKPSHLEHVAAQVAANPRLLCPGQ